MFELEKCGKSAKFSRGALSSVLELWILNFCGTGG